MPRRVGWSKTVTRNDVIWKNNEKRRIVHLQVINLKQTNVFYMIQAYKIINKKGANVQLIKGTQKQFKLYNKAFAYSQDLMKRFL